MAWQEAYKTKCVTAAEAVSHIRSGDRVVLPNAAAETKALTDAMVQNAAAYKDVELVHMITMSPTPYCDEGMQAHFRHNSLFASAATRGAVNEGRADFTPVYFSEIPALIHSMECDVALLHTSAPDEHGYCSYGVSVDYQKAAGESAKCKIALVNKQMPRTLGSGFIHVDELDYIVETDTPIPELQPPHLGEVELGIGRNVAGLVRDGDTLQLGIGAIPDAVLQSLKDKKDLGIHSEMFSDGVVDLINAGVITNRRKTLKPGRCVATFLMGTKKLYDYVHNNPAVEMHPVDYVNDPRVISQNDNLVSINSCVEVDLMGQVVSASIGPKQFSGVGGQVDFVRGSRWSKGGRTVMAMPSTAARGKISRIVPLVAEGAAVTTNRYDVDYVVTEYGIAKLRGETLRARARALIKIAHPDFIPGLQTEYERRFKERY